MAANHSGTDPQLTDASTVREYERPTQSGSIRLMTCRDEVLAAFQRLMSRTSRQAFSPAEIVREVTAVTSAYRESTIRTHVASRMCANAPDHHAVAYDDLERVERGLYQLRTTLRP